MADGNPHEDRRKHQRWLLRSRAECTVISDGQWIGAHLCENISAGGALIIGPGGLNVGDKLELTVNVSEANPIEVGGEVKRSVVRSQFASSYGIAFTDVSAEQEALICKTFLADVPSTS